MKTATQWNKENTRPFTLKLNRMEDAKLIEWLEQQPTINNALKAALGEYIANHESMPALDYGWNEIGNGIEVLVEDDGSIIRGTKYNGDRTAYPYYQTGPGTWDVAEDLTKDNFWQKAAMIRWM